MDITTLLLEHGAAYYPIYKELGLELDLAVSKGRGESAKLLIDRYKGKFNTCVVLQGGRQALITKPERRWIRKDIIESAIPQ